VLGWSIRSSTRRLFFRGFIELLPLWAGAVPSGLAFGVAARSLGLGVVESQLMSLIVFSAPGQMGALSLLGTAPVVLLVTTVMALNAQLLLVGLAVGRQLHLSWTERLIAAWFLTDGSYGVVAARGHLSLPALLGSGVSMFVGWNLGTAIGFGIGDMLADPRRLGIDVIVPLTFLAVLVPLVRTRANVVVVLVSGFLALLLTRFVPVGAAVLGAGVAGSIVGAVWARPGRDASAKAASRNGIRP
jgi:predicted branched-subunit amino acid permease